MTIALLLLAAWSSQAEDFKPQFKKGGGAVPAAQGQAVPGQENAALGAGAGGGEADACPLHSMEAGKRDAYIKTVMFPTLISAAGFRPESDWQPVLYIVGKSAAEKKRLDDYGLSKALAAAYDPGVDFNDTNDHVVLLTTRLFEDKVACNFKELGFILAHEVAHLKRDHMETLKKLKIDGFHPWWKVNKDKYRGTCPETGKDEQAACFKAKVFSKFVEETPAIAARSREHENEADTYGNHYMTQVNQMYSKEDGQKALMRIKEFEKRENIPSSDMYDSEDVRATLLNRGF